MQELLASAFRGGASHAPVLPPSLPCAHRLRGPLPPLLRPQTLTHAFASLRDGGREAPCHAGTPRCCKRLRPRRPTGSCSDAAARGQRPASSPPSASSHDSRGTPATQALDLVKGGLRIAHKTVVHAAGVLLQKCVRVRPQPPPPTVVREEPRLTSRDHTRSLALAAHRKCGSASAEAWVAEAMEPAVAQAVRVRGPGTQLPASTGCRSPGPAYTNACAPQILQSPVEGAGAGREAARKALGTAVRARGAVTGRPLRLLHVRAPALTRVSCARRGSWPGSAAALHTCTGE